MPIDFAIERQRHAGFIGRAGLLAQLDRLLIEERVDRWVVVTGGPGMGKSAVLAAWLARREAAGDKVPHHFIRRGWANWDDPATLVGSLVAQIDARFPEQREPDANARMAPAARLAAALMRVSERELGPRGERLVMLIDALDEYDPSPGSPAGDPLAAFLPYALPRGVSVVCASRPRHPYVDALATRGALVQLDLDDKQRFAVDNEATVRAFWELAAPELGLDAWFIAEAVERARGNLQHAVTLRQHLAGLTPEQRHVEDIPLGLAGLLVRTWERIAVDPLIVDGLGVLCASREALTLDELGAVAGWTGEPQRRAFVRGTRELLIESRRNGSVREYRLHHDSIRAYVANEISTPALVAHHRALADKLAAWPAPKEAVARRYALRHALLHRAEAGEWADAWRLASDMTFLEAKCRELGAQDIEADVTRTAERCRTGGDEALCKRFDDLARALGRESHWLRAAPEATAALVWNRLRQSGWSPDDLDQQLQIPANARFLRVRHLATRESPALKRDLVGHTGWVTACVVTPNERRIYVVSASNDKTLKVWDLGTGALLTTMEGHADNVTACAVTPNGRRVVSASDDRTLKVWDLRTGTLLATLEGHVNRVTACAVMPDGQRVVLASDDKTLKVWDLGAGALLATLEGHADWVRACAVTPDGQRVISASDDKTLKVWDLGAGALLATLEGHADWVRACAVTPDGRRVVSASRDRTLKVWDLGTGALEATLEGHADGVRACAVAPDGRRVVSASDDKTLKVWDLGTGALEATLEGHADWVSACAVTPDGRRVVSASHDRTLKVWDLGAGAPLATLEDHADGVTAWTVTPDGRRVVSASEDETLKLWDLGTRARAVALKGHADRVTACAVTPDGRYMVSASEDKTLKVWDLETGALVATLEGHAERVTACEVTPDGRHVVSASGDGMLKVWDLGTGALVATLEGHADRVTACAVTPDGRRVVSASGDGTLRVWDLGTGARAVALNGHADRVTACEVTPDGRHVVSASRDETLKVWDLGTGALVAMLEGHADTVTACALTPDGRRVVSVSDDKTLKVWDLGTGALLATLEGHAYGVLACAVTPDGRCAVSASDDKTLKVWDLGTGVLVATLEGHADRVTACAVMPDGRRVVSVSHDRTLKVWDLASGTCLLTHYANAAYTAFVVTATAIVAGDAAGAVWFLDWPSPNGRAPIRDHEDHAPQHGPSQEIEPASQRTPMKHTILFLAANPLGTDPRALDREARAIHVELERSGFRDSFELVTRWAAEPLDLLRELRKLKPTVVHFSGQGSSAVAGARPPDAAPHRDVVAEHSPIDSAPQHGLFFQGSGGRSQLVSTDALEEAFDATGSSVKLVVLNACYSELQAAALLTRVDCVVGMRGSIREDAARSFAIGFYGGLGERESVAAAYKQGCAAIRLEGLSDADRPQLQTRRGVDAAQLILASAPQASRPGASAATAHQPSTPGTNPAPTPKVDIGILTIRDDEFRAVLAAFPDKAGTHKGASREYTLRHANAGDDKRYRIAVSRLIEQGNGEAQNAARDLIEDLSPRLVLVVGIAGAPPSEDVKLGDVVVSTRIHDFTVEARKAGQEPAYSVTGGPIDESLAAFVTNLAAREDELGSWTADLPSSPPVTWESEGQLYGPPDWQRELRDKLAHHHGAGSTPGAPVYSTGPIAASDRLVKDPELLIPWLRTARDLRAIEMESAGVYRAVRGRCPMLAIRGISDIVGLKRSDAWTKYACASAAAFTRAFLRTRPAGDPS